MGSCARCGEELEDTLHECRKYGLGRDGSQSPVTPVHSADPSRYDGKPLLRLLECWVAWLVGELDAATADKMRALEPHLARTWGSPGPWHDQIERAIQVEAGLKEHIKAMWQRNIATAEKLGERPPLDHFCRAIADQMAGGPG